MALTVVLLGLVAPFGIASVYAVVRPGIGIRAARDGFVSCAVPTVFVTFLLHLLVSLQVPQDIANGCALLTPFVLTGIAAIFDQQNWKPLTVLPCGLPYDVNGWDD